MKTKTTQSKLAEAAVGAAIGAAIAGPLGAAAGGLAAGHVESGLEQLTTREPARRRRKAGDPMRHSHPRRILVPLDFSPPSRRALKFALEWAVLFGSEVRLLHVLERTTVLGEAGTVPLGQVQRDPAGRTREALQDIARREFPAIVPVSVEVRTGSAGEEIVRAAGAWEADLILIVTHGHTGLQHALLGSTAERIVRHAPCPVLTLRRAPAARD